MRRCPACVSPPRQAHRSRPFAALPSRLADGLPLRPFFRPRSSRCYSRFRMSATSTGPSNSRLKRRAAATSAEHSSSASPRSAKRNRKPAAAPPVVVLRRDGDLVECEDGRWRCSWAVSAADYVKYHDEEWGRRVPHTEDQLYERLTLEGFQAGLSWLTILRKRENFRKYVDFPFQAFANFKIPAVAAFTASDVDRLLGDSGIVRHRGKIEAAIANARGLQELHKSGVTLASLFEKHAPKDRTLSNALADHATKTEEGVALSKFLQSRGFKFVGPTTLHSSMQACGYVNAHLKGCCVRTECEPK